ncbi:MAG: pilus assembly protein TadG-related protein [Tepidisphaeraceae bacterium]|jgi:Flp pilus assembly protein TadG
MIHSTKKWENHPRRRGAAIIYVLVSMVAMMGFCSFAVDLGRVQTAKTEIRRAADAAARVAAAYLSQESPGATSGPVQTQAEGIAKSNRVDGTPLVLADTNIVTGSWDTTRTPPVFTKWGTANPARGIYSAVQVSAVRQIPLLFGSILGARTCNVTATSTAALVSIQAPVIQYVSAHGNPWLAGEPTGTLASQPDQGYADSSHPWKYDVAGNSGTYSSSGTPQYTNSKKVESTDYTTDEPYESPTEFALDVQPGSVIQISVPLNSENLATNSGYYNGQDRPSYEADGSNNGSYAIYSDDGANPSLPQGSVTTSGSEHGISNIAVPINSMIGVFLDNNVPDKDGAVPAGIDYSTQTERDYLSVEPDLRQAFYVGAGQTSLGDQQTIIVPAGATRLFLGTMDGHEWSNNLGGFNATISQFEIELVH